MLTVYYVAATWLQSWRLSSILQKIRQVSQKNGSIVIHQELPPYIYCHGTVQQTMEVSSVLSELCTNHKEGHVGDLFWYSGNKRIVSVFPKQRLDISGWIKVIPGRTHLPLQIKGIKTERCLSEENYFHILVEANYNTCQYNFSPNILELENFGEPIAWHVGGMISILLRTDDVNLSHLSVTFMQNKLTLENGIEIMRIQSVDVSGSPYKVYNFATVPQTYAPLDPRLSRSERKNFFMSRWRAHVSMLLTFCEAVDQVKDSYQDISVRHPGSGVGAVKLVPSNYANDEDGTSINSSNENEIMEKFNSLPSNICVVESQSPSSGPSSSHVSTDMSTAQGSTRLAADSATTSLSSLKSLPVTPRRTFSPDVGSDRIKPPNIIIFSDSVSAADSVKVALESTLINDRYTIYSLGFSDMLSAPWLHQACLVVIHGNVPPTFTPVIIKYLLQSCGSLLVLCSDFLGSILPMFHTAEVRPNELVQCSYKSWKHVPLMHHVFCYQPTPMAPQFSHDEHSSLRAIPDSVEIKDSEGQSHKLKIDILGAEETWQTPSFLLVSSMNSSAKIVFSQVHLEVAPSQYESDDKKRQALEKSDRARLEILCDVLGSHLGLHCSIKQLPVAYTQAYFLGNHEAKQKVLDELQKEGLLDSNCVVKAGNLNLKFCGKGVSPPTPSSTFLPVLKHSCPHSFSTVDYFENLKTESIGRLIIFSEVISSSMQVIESLDLCHGFTVVPFYQTKGKGRGKNTWLSPKGCAMFSLQLHLPFDSYLGKYPSMLQHITSLAVVSSICQISGLEDLDLGIKWPNDIYVNKKTKVGGVLVSSIMTNNKIICNIGCGVNLSNKEPTVCINDIISAVSEETGTKISPLSYEIYFANVFNKLEELYKMAQSDLIEEVKAQYYSFWLHSDVEVEVKSSENIVKKVKIKGIDSYGFLTVETISGEFLTLQPDGNTFDMLSNLIISN